MMSADQTKVLLFLMGTLSGVTDHLNDLHTELRGVEDDETHTAVNSLEQGLFRLAESYMWLNLLLSDAGYTNEGKENPE